MQLPALPRFTRAEILFSLKSFAGAMLAMYLANRAGLPRPFWALLTAYIVAHPLAGAVRSKALFRFLGTFIGSIATVLLVPLLSNAPELLSLVMALWVAGCLYVSLLDRTPRSYVSMLAGYTAALIGFPTVEMPTQVFDTAVARVEEIGLGILCATLVHSLVLPQGLATSVLGLLDRTLADTRRWLTDLVQPGGRGEEANPRTLTVDRRRLAADLTQLRLLSTHIPFDTTHLRWTAGAIRAMQDRVAALTPTLSAVEDRLHAIEQAEGGLPQDVVTVLDDIHHWLERKAVAAAGENDATDAEVDNAFEALRTSIRALGRPTGAIDWPHALRVGLAGRLEELVEGWRACARLRRHVDAGLQGDAVPLRRMKSLSSRELHLDRGMALLSAFAAMLAVSLCCAFWILTGWSMGSVAAMMAAVFCSLFATMDDPVPAIHGFLKFTLWSVPISAVYVLILMPGVQDFGMLVLVCAPTFLVLGLYMARPANTLAALALLFGVGGTLALHDTGTADFVSFINSTTAQVLGVVVAARITRLVRSVGATWSAQRIQRATWRELSEMASAPRLEAAGSAYAVRMLDRIGLLAPRIAQAGGTVEGVVAHDAQVDLRLGADIVTLQRTRAHLPAAAIAQLLADIAAFFGRRAGGQGELSRPPGLLVDIDAALAGALAAPDASHEWRSAVTALVGLRRNLFPEAPVILTVSQGVAA